MARFCRSATEFVFCTAAVIFAAATSALAGTFVPITPPTGSTTTYVFGINDSNTIAGGYVTSDGVEHGFYGPLNGTYTTVDDGTGGTELRGINNSGYLTGYADRDTCSEYTGTCAEFEVEPSGTIVPITDKGAQLYGIVQGINSSKNEFVGDYDNGGGLSGFYGKSGEYLKALTLGFSTAYTYPRGINGSNLVVGFFYNSSKTYSGFVLSKGIATVITYPNKKALYTLLLGLNDNGIAAGQWLDSKYNFHAFMLDTKSSTFTPIKVPNSTSSGAGGINSSGLVLVSGSDGANYVYCPTRKNCPSDRARSK